MRTNRHGLVAHRTHTGIIPAAFADALGFAFAP